MATIQGIANKENYLSHEKDMDHWDAIDNS